MPSYTDSQGRFHNDKDPVAERYSCTVCNAAYPTHSDWCLHVKDPWRSTPMDRSGDAIALRAALKEALDGWESSRADLNYERGSGSAAEFIPAEYARIVELRLLCK